MRKRSMIARLSSLIVIATLLSGCTSFAPFAPRSTAIPTLTLTPTVTLTPTITPSPTPSSTPTPVPPSVPHGLRQENAATQTYENGTWVTKNAAGEITGTWNEQASEWTYDMDNINIHQVVVGHPIFTPEKYATDILARHLPPTICQRTLLTQKPTNLSGMARLAKEQGWLMISG